MRTLKKTLCLVLVLAMMVGLCAMGASAVSFDDYKDKDQVQNVEAVKVLTGMGILQGDDQGTFRPNDALTRAEGATFFTKLCAQTGAGIPSFTDMGSYAWANGAVAYCEQNGIINGYGDGRFGPGDALSTVAFAKMCLCALGYDATIEGLVGPQWEINTIKLVNKINLADGVDNPQWNGPITRDTAAQFGFNTLKATMVQYKGGTNVNVNASDGTKVDVTTASEYEPIENNSYDYRGIVTRRYYDETYTEPYDDEMQFVENFFPNVKLAFRGDRFGYPTDNWFTGKSRNDNTWQITKQFAVVNTDGVMATYEKPAGVTTATVYADSGWNTMFGALPVMENGEYAVTEDDGSYVIDKDIALAWNGTARLGYAGATASLIDSEGDSEANYLAVKYAYLAMVTKVTPANKTESTLREVTLAVYNKSTGIPTTATFPTEDFNRFDYVLAYPAGNIYDTHDANSLTILELGKPEVVTGKLSKVGSTRGTQSSLTVDGVAYSIGAADLANMGVSATVSGTTYNLNTNYTLYMANGAVLGVAGELPSYTNYVFAMKYKAAENDDLTKPNAANVVYNVGAVKQDGTTETVTAEAAGMPWEINESGSGNVYGWFAPRTSNGITTFVTPTGTVKEVTITMNETNGNKIKKDTPTIAKDDNGSIVADANTAFIFYTASGYKTYTGIANVPTYELARETTAYALVTTRDDIAKAVFINLYSETEKDDSSEKIYILSSASSSVQHDETLDVDVYTYPAIVGDEITTIESTISTWSASGETDVIGLVTPTRNSAGYVTGTKAVATSGDSATAAKFTTIAADTGITLSGGTLTINGTSFATDSNTKAFYYNASKPALNVAAGEVSEIVGAGASTVVAVWSSTSAVLKTVYVIA